MKVSKKIVEEQKPAGPAVAGKAVRVRALLYFKRPKAHFKKDGALKPGAPVYVLKRPDVDNCLKFILDAPGRVRGAAYSLTSWPTIAS